MESKVNYTIVGAFVILLTAITVIAIIWLSSGLSFDEYSTYQIYMQESVSGLSIDSQVEYNGVEVGKVTSIELNRSNPQLVEVLVNIKNTTPITQGTVATLTTRGLTGLVYVALKDKSSNLKPLTAVSGAKYPVIKTAPSIFVRLDTALTGLSQNLQQVAASVSTLLNEKNLASINAILNNMREVTGTLAVNSQKLDIILANSARATQQLTPLLKSGQNALRMLEVQTFPETYRLLSNLDSITRSLAEASAQIKQNPAVLIRGSAQPLLGPGETR